MPRLLPTIRPKRNSLIHSDSTWWWQPSWILSFWIQTLPSWIETPCYLLSDSLKKHSHSTLTLTQTTSIWLKLIHSHLTWSMAAILNSVILNLAILGFSHLSISSQTHSHLPRLVPTICTKNFTHSFWLNLKMAANWNSVMLDSSILPKKKPHSFILIQLDDGSHLEFCHFAFCHLAQKKPLIHSDSTWWWQPSWIPLCWIQTLPSWIQTPCYLLSDSLKNTLTPLWLWLKLIHSDSNSFSLIQLEDGSHLEFCHLKFGHLGFSHLSISSQTHSHLLRLVLTICTRKI